MEFKDLKNAVKSLNQEKETKLKFVGIKKTVLEQDFMDAVSDFDFDELPEDVQEAYKELTKEDITPEDKKEPEEKPKKEKKIKKEEKPTEYKKSQLRKAAKELVEKLELEDDDDELLEVPKKLEQVQKMLFDTNTFIMDQNVNLEKEEVSQETINILDFIFKQMTENETAEERQQRMVEEIEEEESITSPFHPIADMFPMMSDDEFQKLKEDIKENGLIVPILKHNNLIIDGRNRYLACEELDIEPDYEEFDEYEGSLTAHILSLNLHRRQLTTAQKAAVGVEAEKHFAKEAKERQKEGGKGKVKLPEDKKGQARDKAAKAVGVSPSTISKAKKIEKEQPEDFKKLKSGETTISKVTKKVQKPKKITAKSIQDKIENELKLTEDALEAAFDFIKVIKNAKVSNWQSNSKKDLLICLNSIVDLLK